MQQMRTKEYGQRRLGMVLLPVLVASILLAFMVAGIVMAPEILRRLGGEPRSPAPAQTGPLSPEQPAVIPESTMPAPVPETGELATLPQPGNLVNPERLAPGDARQPPSLDHVVALVNGEVIGSEAVVIMTAVDRAMSDLFNVAMDSQGSRLGRLVNAELVRQAAQAGEFTFSSDEVDQALRALLEGKGKQQADLDNALAQNGLTGDDFRHYFANLLLVDRFSRVQAQSQGINVPDYLQQLQNAAHISFGPAAPPLQASDTAAGQDATAVSPSEVVVAATAVPSSTPTLVSDLPRGINTGQLSPSFQLPGLNPAEVATISWDDMVGSPTVISFFTTWCPYCRQQTPALVAAVHDFSTPGPGTLPTKVLCRRSH